MTRISALLVAAALTLAATAAAQNTMPQPGPQGTTNNQNGPQMQTSAQPSAKAGVKASTAAPEAKATAQTSDAANTAGTAAPAAAAKTPHVDIVETPSSGPLSSDPLLQPPPLPPNKSTLIGGLARKVDPIRNRLVVAPFGSSKKITVRFDERSHIYRDGRETTVLGIHRGDRVYVDSMLVGPDVFARNIRVVTTMTPAEASGQVIAYDERSKRVRMIDKLTNSPVDFRLTKDTQIHGGDNAIQPGAIVSVVFAPGQHGGAARQLKVLAVPGSKYIFAGRVTNLDLHLGIVDLENQSDGKNYELHFNPANMPNARQLHVGSQVAANATFDGRTYTAQDLTIMPEAAPQTAQQ